MTPAVQVNIAVLVGDSRAVTSLLASLPNGLSPRTLMRGGIRDGDKKLSIAQLCVKRRNVSLIKAFGELVAEYYAAGHFDLNRTLMISVNGRAGCTPLEATLRNACAGGARALILLGCDVKQVLDRYPDFDGDLLKLAHSYSHRAETIEPFVAALTEALMERRLRVPAEQARDTLAQTDVPTAALRRQKRAQL